MIKLCLSNLAWGKERNDEIHGFMREVGFDGLEIAPSKLFGENPYEHIEPAVIFANKLRADFALDVVSMQSIWYRRDERVFENERERGFLFDYTKKAVDFASAVGCGNVVFGSPKNRVIKDKSQMSLARDFFFGLGEYASEKKTVLAIEPNPELYGTNFLNTTKEALDFCRDAASGGLKVNLDFGTIIANGEDVDFSLEDVRLIGHVHISEPNLKPIKKRREHLNLRDILQKHGYCGYVSIEMIESQRDADILDAAVYLKEVFG